MRIWIMAAAVLALLSGCGGGSSISNDGSESRIGEPEPYEAPAISESEKQAYLDAINDARSHQQDCGSEGIKDPAPALSWNDKLYRAAYEHSRDLAESNTWSHDGSGTSSDWTAQVQGLEYSTFRDRIENNGYTSWSRIGENITAGTDRDTARKAVEAWLQSDGHCANLMDPDYTEVGMAHYRKDGSDYTHYWTQDLGTPQ